VYRDHEQLQGQGTDTPSLKLDFLVINERQEGLSCSADQILTPEWKKNIDENFVDSRKKTVDTLRKSFKKILQGRCMGMTSREAEIEAESLRKK
jgi:hypothetical protein